MDQPFFDLATERAMRSSLKIVLNAMFLLIQLSESGAILFYRLGLSSPDRCEVEIAPGGSGESRGALSVQLRFGLVFTPTAACDSDSCHVRAIAASPRGVDAAHGDHYVT